MVVLVGVKAEEAKDAEEIGLVPNGFRLEGAGCNGEWDDTIGVDGNDAVCVAGGGDIVGVDT